MPCHHWPEKEPDWNKAASLQRLKYKWRGWQVGTQEGRQSRHGQRFWARGEDPDQFAGWFGQRKIIGNTLCY